MKDFLGWLENVAVANQQRTSTGNGNWGNNNNDDGDGGDDDDFENGPWGWNKMKSLNLKLHEWAKTSPVMNQIKQLYVRSLFSTQPQENVRVFPQHVQLEVEWNFNIHEWSTVDEQVESMLKRSDLWKPLGITQAELWNVMDKGAVYDYTSYVILIALTGRGLNTGERSYLDNQAGFHAYEYMQQNWNEKESLIKSHIEAFHQENQLNPGQITLSAPKQRPTGISQVYGENLWAKGIVMIPYTISGSYDNPEVWDSWGNDRPLRDF
jgi:hypothetical protein